MSTELKTVPVQKVLKTKTKQPKKRVKKEYFKEFQKYVIVPFEEYFGEESEDYDEFTISVAAKKTYAKISNYIVSSNNDFLNEYPELAQEFIYKLYTLKMGLDNRKYDDTRSFINDVIASIFTTEMKQAVQEYVDKCYQIYVDETINQNKTKYDPSTTFYDRHYKILYQVSVMSRLIIPLATHFIYCNPTTEANPFLVDLMIAIINVVQAETGIDIYTKLHTYTVKQVKKTLYSDRVMWDRIKILAVTPETTIEDTLTKLLTNVIPKYVFDMDLMNLNIVVTNKSVREYTLRKKDDYTLYALSTSDTISSGDDSIVTEADIFDSYNTKRDESVLFFRRHGTRQVINRIMMREGVSVDPDELKFYMDTFEYHDFQKFAVIQVFSKYFGGGENILAVRKVEWVMLVIILTKIMEKVGIPELIKYVTGIKKSYAYRRMSKNLDTAINENALYQDIINTKYRFVQGLIEKKNVIKLTIISLINNTYVYNEYKNPDNGQFISKNETEITNAVLQMFNKLIL